MMERFVLRVRGQILAAEFGNGRFESFTVPPIEYVSGDRGRMENMFLTTLISVRDNGGKGHVARRVLAARCPCRRSGRDPEQSLALISEPLLGTPACQFRKQGL